MSDDKYNAHHWCPSTFGEYDYPRAAESQIHKYSRPIARLPSVERAQVVTQFGYNQKPGLLEVWYIGTPGSPRSFTTPLSEDSGVRLRYLLRVLSFGGAGGAGNDNCIEIEYGDMEDVDHSDKVKGNGEVRREWEQLTKEWADA
ncbi:hypothetical protein PM082_000547 [Marasmius tenuissimus]|nr:hypothetical protein PM082_000547 [Marasmius tenuissimus]